MMKVQNNVKTSWNYNLAFGLPPKERILSILAKDFLKYTLSLSHIALFPTKTRVFRKYFVRGSTPAPRNHLILFLLLRVNFL